MPGLRLRAEKRSLIEEKDGRLPAVAAGPDAVAALFLIVIDVLLYRKVARLWWTYDDANTIRLILTHGVGDPFRSAEVWPQQLFTPMLTVLFEAGYALFALDATGWYLAQLGLMCASSIAVYGAVRMFIPRPAALSAAAVYSTGVPLCSIVTQLSTAHYLLAVTLASLSVILFARSIRTGSRTAALLSASSYLAAILSKEIAILVPLLLVALPVGELRVRTRRVAGHAAALVLYLGWRHSVLGTVGGAYGWVIEPAAWPRLVALLPWRLAEAMAGVNPAAGFSMLALIAAALVAAAARSRRALLLLAIGAVVAVAPLLPVAREVNRRYALAPWLAASVAFGVATASSRNRRFSGALLVAVPVLALVANRQEWGRESGVRQRMSDEARFFLEMPANGLLRLPATPPAAMGELNWLRTMRLGKPAGAAWFYDDFFLCANEIAGRQVWEYDPARRMLVDITTSIGAITRRHCGSIRKEAPMTAEFRYRAPALFWTLGPRTDGRYAVLIGDGIQAFEVPRRDGLNLPGVQVLPLRVRYDSPEGWTAYSDALNLDFTTQSAWSWRR